MSMFRHIARKIVGELEDGGEDVRVCSFYSADGATDWTLLRSWGVCNRACVSAYCERASAEPKVNQSTDSGS